MGEAYLADDLLLHREVVIKRMSRRMDREDDRQRFLSEAKRAAAINNSHVVQIYDALDVEGELLLVLEYVDGGDLRHKYPNGITLEQFFPLALQIADGVIAAHAAHVVHCDLKPGNVLLTRDGTAKVLDFGLARPTPRQDAATISTTQPKFAGTPGFMSPEMIREEALDERADIFSLGVIFYELLTSSHPFAGPTLLETLHNTVHHEPQPVTRFDRAAPPEMDWIMNKMLAKSREDRYQSVREVVTDLNTCQRKLYGSPVSTRILAMPRKKRHSRTRYWALIAAVLTLLIAAAGFFSIRRHAQPITSQGTAPIVPVHYRSVAVLPFQIIGDSGKGLEAYSDGICVTLTSKLARIAADHQLQVTPASEVRRRSLNNASAAKQQLGSDLVIEGQLEKLGDAVRITYNLVDTGTMSQLRSEQVEDKIDNSFRLEDKIVDGALKMLDVQLEASERQSLEQRGTSDPAAYDLFLTGSGYLREYDDPGNVERAIDSFQGALLKDANYAQASAALGRAYWSKYQLTHEPSLVAQARVACEAAVTKSPALPDSHLCLGIIDSGTGRYENAVKELETVVQMEPSNDVALRELASLYENTNNPASAEQVYKRGIAARPHYWAGYYLLGAFYARQARYEEAATQFREAIAESPSNASLYSSLGGIYILQGKNTEAIEALQKAVALRPGSAVYQNLGQAYLHERRFEDAINAFKQALDQGDRSYALYSVLGDAYAWSHIHPDEAITAYQESNKIALEQQRVNPRDLSVNVMLAYNFAALGDQAHSLDYLKRAQQAQPKDAETMFFAARIYARLNQPAEAADRLRQAIELGYSKADIEACPDLDAVRAIPDIRKALA